MDPEVEALARRCKLDEARELAMSRGDAVRALELAIEARDPEAVRQTARAIPAEARARARAAAIRMREPFAEGCVAEADAALEDATSLFDRAEAWSDAARVHRARGDVAKAGRALERHLERDPTDDGARKQLAELLLSIGRAEACLRALSALATDADDPEIEALRVRAHQALGLSDGPPVAPVVPLDSELLFGRYAVLREVASTPSSRVLEASDRLDPSGRRVALKIFAGAGHTGAGRDALARFRREIEALSLLDQPTVLKPLAFLAEGPTLVLPWAAGGSLETLLARGLPSPRRAAEITSRVLEALDAAHRRGIIHRDVKPANVLLDEAGGALLADFGVAHLGDASATATAGVIGTLRYMSPEQRRGEPATPRSDLFSVGVLLAELLGVPLEPSGWAALPALVAALLRDLLAEDEHARPADAALVRDRIAAIAWPDEPLGEARRPSLHPSGGLDAPRFVERNGVIRDVRLERDELRVGPDDPRHALALALATLSHPALPAVLGVEGDRLRVEAFEGPNVTALSERERDRLAEALELLHRAGAAHGAVETSIVSTPGGPVLTVTSLTRAALEGASPAADRAALARV